MVVKERQMAAIRALQAVIIRARTMALEKEDHGKIADLMDRAEYLMALLHDERDMTTTFRSHLVEAATIHGCGIALTRFDQDY